MRLDLATLEARDVTQEPWYGTQVLWGERVSLQEVAVGDNSGPMGPSSGKGPLTDADPREPGTETDLPWWLPQPTGPIIVPWLLLKTSCT